MNRRQPNRRTLGALVLIAAVLVGSAAYAIAATPSGTTSADQGLSQDPVKAEVERSHLAHVASQLANAPTTTKPTDYAALHPSPSNCDPSWWDNGVQYGHETMFPKGVINATSSFGVTVDSVHYVAYFGEDFNDPSTGLVAVLSMSMCGKPIAEHIYPLAGMRRLTAVEGLGTTTTVAVSTEDGQRFDFNVASGAVSALK